MGQLVVLVVALAATCSATAFFLASRRILVVPVFPVKDMVAAVQVRLRWVPLVLVAVAARRLLVWQVWIMRLLARVLLVVPV
jgi:hypothetical protein